MPLCSIRRGVAWDGPAGALASGAMLMALPLAAHVGLLYIVCIHSMTGLDAWGFFIGLLQPWHWAYAVLHRQCAFICMCAVL